MDGYTPLRFPRLSHDGHNLMEVPVGVLPQKGSPLEPKGPSHMETLDMALCLAVAMGEILGICAAADRDAKWEFHPAESHQPWYAAS